MATKINIRTLLEAGCHFGHQTRRWNPKMKPFIFGERNGIYILDLKQTILDADQAYTFVKNVAKGGNVLFVGTKKQAQEAVKNAAERANMPYINQRWLGGMLTNFVTIRSRINRMEELEAMVEDGRMAVLPKKEQAVLGKELTKLQTNLGGARDMKGLPQALFVIDTKREENAIKEAQRLNIPVVALIDTNSDPDEVEYGIPCNDDAISAVTLMCELMADACLAGSGKEQVSEAEMAAEPKAEQISLSSFFFISLKGTTMAQITAAMVKQLREMTDSPMMECKKALVEADGDMDTAVDVLRKNGLAKAAKKAGRETNEGAVAAFVSEDGKSGALLELSCETDFVGSNAKFTGFASKVAEVVATTEPADVDALLEMPMGEETVSSELTEMIHIMGENMKISRFAARKAENGALASYIHMGGKIGVLVEFAFEKAETAQAESFKTFAHDVALQVAAVAPICATRDQVPAETVEHEKQIYMAQAAESGKPEAIQEKMAVGRLEKFYKQSVLTEQEFIKDSSLTIKKYAEQVSKELGDTITVVAFDRLVRGE